MRYRLAIYVTSLQHADKSTTSRACKTCRHHCKTFRHPPYSMLREALSLPKVLPDVQCCITAPRPPCLRQLFGSRGCHSAQSVAERDVLFWKCVRPAQGAHGNVLGGPGTY